MLIPMAKISFAKHFFLAPGFNFVFFLAFTLAHLLQLLFDLQPILGSCNDSSLGYLLSVFVVENHAHCVLQILKLFGINDIYLGIGDFAIFNKRKQDVCRESLHFQVELLGNLALLQALVDPPDMLSQCGVIVVFNAVVRPISYVNI